MRKPMGELEVGNKQVREMPFVEVEKSGGMTSGITKNLGGTEFFTVTLLYPIRKVDDPVKPEDSGLTPSSSLSLVYKMKMPKGE